MSVSTILCGRRVRFRHDADQQRKHEGEGAIVAMMVTNGVHFLIEKDDGTLVYAKFNDWELLPGSGEQRREAHWRELRKDARDAARSCFEAMGLAVQLYDEIRDRRPPPEHLSASSIALRDKIAGYRKVLTNRQIDADHDATRPAAAAGHPVPFGPSERRRWNLPDDGQEAPDGEKGNA